MLCCERFCTCNVLAAIEFVLGFFVRSESFYERMVSSTVDFCITFGWCWPQGFERLSGLGMETKYYINYCRV